MTRGLETAEFVTANAFVRRSALISVGGFDERFLRAWREDSDLQFRLLREAARSAAAPTAVVDAPGARRSAGASACASRRTSSTTRCSTRSTRACIASGSCATPPWDYYAVVALTSRAPCCRRPA